MSDEFDVIEQEPSPNQRHRAGTEDQEASVQDGQTGWEVSNGARDLGSSAGSLRSGILLGMLSALFTEVCTRTIIRW
jgi:hypothetical protein